MKSRPLVTYGANLFSKNISQLVIMSVATAAAAATYRSASEVTTLWLAV